MHNNANAGLVQLLLSKGVHLREIQRFVETNPPAVDPAADTIPAPPVETDDPDERPTTPVPAGRRFAYSTISPPPFQDFRDVGEDYWDEVAGLLECLPV